MKNPLAGKRVIICAGPGGVGKTTTAAALAVACARVGLRTVVATIDPAPRLVDALALTQLDPQPRPLPEATARRFGLAPNTMYASRIDAAQAFAGLVSEFAGTPERKARILSNAIYHQITTTLTGAQEYAAALSLQALADDPRFDLVILDTPPAANALEFFDAPTRLSAAIESPLVRWLVPGSEPKVGVRKLMNMGRLSSGGGMALRALSRLVGSQFLADLGEFLSDFYPVMQGFSSRTQAVQTLLTGPQSATVVVCIAEPQAMDEAIAFTAQLVALGVPPQAFVVNRVMPAPLSTSRAELESALGALPTFANDAAGAFAAAKALGEASSVVQVVAAQQAHQRDRLARSFTASAVATVPLHEAPGGALDLLDQTALALTAKGLLPTSLEFTDAPWP